VTLLLQVLVGALLGFAFIWALTVVGTRITKRRTDAALSALRARIEINAIRRETVRRLLRTSRQLDRRFPDDGTVIDGEGEPRC